MEAGIETIIAQRGQTKAPRFAYAHDWLVGLRGGELVLDRIIRLFGPGPLYTLVRNGVKLSDAIDACEVRTSMLQRVPGASGPLRRWMLPLMPMAVDRLQVADCDVLISTSSCVMKGIRPPRGAKHICYCHSPARYIWSQQQAYAGALRGTGLRLLSPYFRRWDRRTAANVDLFIAPSTYIAQRIEECFGAKAIVIFPPVRTEFFTPDENTPREDFWLLAAALEPFKRIDIAIEAADRTRQRLVIAGDGSLRKQLQSMAGPTVEFLGAKAAVELRDLYRRAKVFLFPSLEDFGIAPVEAMACGCPVAALAGGGALDTVNDSCGAFMKEQTADGLLEAIAEIDRRRIASHCCRQNALRFSEAEFDADVRAVVNQLLGVAV